MDYTARGRSRSRSPPRRYYGEDREGNGYDRQRGGYGEFHDSSRRYKREDHRRGGSRREYGYYRGTDRFSDRRSRPPNRFVDRYQDHSSRSEFGPKLDRTLDSSYDEKVNRNYSNSIFIGNLTYNTTPEDLKQFFGEVGHVVRADIITSRGHHRGMGTVEYTNSGAVDEAIRRYNGCNFMDREIFVRQDNPPPSMERRERRAAPVPRRTHHGGYEIFVANLPYSINWQALKDMFKQCSQVIHADVSVHADGYSRGFGTVYVSTKEDQIAAIKKWNGYEMEGRILEVREGKGTDAAAAPGRGGDYAPYGASSYGQGRDQSYYDRETTKVIDNQQEASYKSSSSTKVDDADFTAKAAPGGQHNNIIYCENMPHATAESDLYDLFETIGKVVRAELKLDSEGQPTGDSVCEFEDAGDAKECIERLDNYHYGGCDLKISYAKYD
ncbi:HCL122Cp [Eremothecium sinecaudum]|uniref:HCL122Cp n=1 Tax=Eremothecium sinecaudum TaxID=45286 RepID=A0A0X8HRB8_9SACH|nr:HCL122Cp [Eremothecium sinecaudum]AMD20029.1 HCL122Cp [Eremothecium sinecaudum]